MIYYDDPPVKNLHIEKESVPKICFDINCGNQHLHYHSIAFCNEGCRCRKEEASTLRGPIKEVENF